MVRLISKPVEISGSLKVVELAYKKGRKPYWTCKCDCGNTTIVASQYLKNGRIRSCGHKCPYYAGIMHNMSDTTTYNTWHSMKQRCYNENTNGYKNYGGRGIIVCDRWLDRESGFLKFLEDMGERPSKKHTLDRIDNNGNYEPGNCRWATLEQQAINRRTAKIITYKDRTMTLTQWANERGIKPSTLSERLRRGWRLERALNFVKEPKCTNCSGKHYTTFCYNKIRKPVAKKGRRTREYEYWRNNVAIPYLDGEYGHKCANCGSQWRLDVDHIKNRGSHPELRMDLKNIQYLCRNCHIRKTNEV